MVPALSPKRVTNARQLPVMTSAPGNRKIGAAGRPDAPQGMRWGIAAGSDLALPVSIMPAPIFHRLLFNKEPRIRHFTKRLINQVMRRQVTSAAGTDT